MSQFAVRSGGLVPSVFRTHTLDLEFCLDINLFQFAKYLLKS